MIHLNLQGGTSRLRSHLCNLIECALVYGVYSDRVKPAQRAELRAEGVSLLDGPQAVAISTSATVVTVDRRERPNGTEELIALILASGFAVTLDPDGVKLRQMRIDATTPQSPLDARCFPRKSRFYSAVLAEALEAIYATHPKQ